MKLFLAALTSFVLLQTLISFSSQNKTKSVPPYAPPKIISKFTFGFQDSFADSLWLRLIQNFEYCGSGKASAEEKTIQGVDSSEEKLSEKEKQPTFEEKVVHQKMDVFDALDDEKLAVAKCNKGWAYQMLDRVTDLAPKFLLAYRSGATILSVVTDDREGAALIYEKGSRERPDDWTLLYRAAYHQLYEMRNYARAAELLNEAGKKGAPGWVRNLASKLYQRTGQLLLGRTVVLELLEVAKGKPLLEKKARAQLSRIDRLLAKEARKKIIEKTKKETQKNP